MTGDPKNLPPSDAGGAGVATPITNARLAQAALESSLSGIAFADAQGKLTYVNRAWLSMWGYEADIDVLGRPATCFWDSPDSADSVVQELMTAGSWSGELTALRADGCLLPVWLVAHLVRDELGEPLALMASFEDDSLRRASEDALRHSEERYRLLAENASDVIWLLGLDMQFQYISPTIQQLTGFAAEERMALGLEGVLTPESADRATQALAAAIEAEAMQQGSVKPIVMEAQLTCRDGTTAWVEVKASFLRDEEGRPKAVLGVTRDIRDRKRAELALRAREAQYRSMFENSPVALWETNLAKARAILEEAGFRPGSPRPGSTELDAGLVARCARSARPVTANAAARELFGIAPSPPPPPDVTGLWTQATFDCFGRGLLELLGGIGAVEDETEVRTAHGDVRRVLIRRSILPGHEDTWERCLVSIVDLSALRRAEDERHVAESRFRALLDASPMGAHLYELRDDGGLVLVGANAAASRILGVDCDALVGLRIEEAFPGLQETPIPEIYRRIATTGEPWHNERVDYEHGAISGAYEVHAFQTQPGHVGVMFLDIADRLRDQANLQRERDLLNSITETSPVGITVVDRRGRISFANAAAERVLGLSRNEITELEYNDPDWRITGLDGGPFPQEELPFHRVMATGQPVEDVRHAIEWPDGRRRLLAINAAPLFDSAGEADGMVATITDVTDRARHEHDLRDSEERLRLALEATSDGVWDWEVATSRFYWSDGCYTMLGYGPGELDPTDLEMWRTLVHPDDQERVVSTLRDHLLPGAGPYTVEFRMRRSGGDWIWLLARGGAVSYDADGRPSRVVGTVADVGERRRTTEALRKAHLQAQRYLDVAEVVLVALDTEGRVVLLNRKGEEVLGYSARELVGRNWFDTCLPESGRDAVKQVFEQILSGHVEPVEYYENPVLAKCGEERLIAWHNAILRDEEGRPTGSLSSGQDITERRQAEERRRQLEERVARGQRMESLGALAGGIAHDFNNILGAIFGYTELTLKALQPDSNEYANLQHVLGASERAKSLVQQILTYARQADQQKSSIRLQPIVEEALRFLRSSTPSTIELREGIDPSCGPVLADATQIHQVLMNLCTNANHAMRDEGGVLTVALEPVQLDARAAERLGDVAPGPYVRLSVSDTGCGMDAETKRRAFEPFFTTKAPGEGTGLGLATTHGIVGSHGGEISVYSEVGQGTTVCVYLPCVADDDDNEDAQQAAMPYA